MNVAIHLITYLSIVVFLGAVVARFRRISGYPLNVRWEIYPVPHEGRRSEHGGSKMEEVDWWDKKHKPDKVTELKFMIPEMLFIKALFEHNRKLWYRSFPFHFGLYLLTGFLGLIFLGAVLQLSGSDLAVTFEPLTRVFGLAGFALSIIGALGLWHMRLTDQDMRPYSNFSHSFNLLVFLAVLILGLAAWGSAGFESTIFRDYLASLIVFDLSAAPGSSLAAAAIVTSSILLAYVPLTHMSHFFVKWFTWHEIRWDDEPNVKGGRIEKMIEAALQKPVTWSAEHINSDGKKNWADVATEEMTKE